MNRPRFTISVLRGLMKMHDLAPAELMGLSKEEELAALGGSKGSRDWDRAAQWLINMQRWYISKGEQL